MPSLETSTDSQDDNPSRHFNSDDDTSTGMDDLYPCDTAGMDGNYVMNIS